MADPILPDFFRAQVVMQGKSNKPEDQFVNNFVFRNDQDNPIAGDIGVAIADRLDQFYDEATPSGTRLSQFISGSSVNSEVTIKVYDLGDAPPRMPTLHTRTWTLGSGNALPSSVAACLSYYAGRSLPRRRGRIYLGPLTTAAITDVVNVGARLAPALLTAMGEAAERLADEGVGGPNWHVLSQVDAQAFHITGGWVDDRPDVQRRRALEASARTLWGAAPAS